MQSVRATGFEPARTPKDSREGNQGLMFSGFQSRRVCLFRHARIADADEEAYWS